MSSVHDQNALRFEFHVYSDMYMYLFINLGLEVYILPALTSALHVLIYLSYSAGWTTHCCWSIASSYGDDTDTINSWSSDGF